MDLIVDMGVLKDPQSALTSFGNIMCEREMVVHIILDMFCLKIWGQMFVFVQVC